FRICQFFHQLRLHGVHNSLQMAILRVRVARRSTPRRFSLMFIPTFAAVLLTTAAVVPQQPAGQILRHVGSATPSELIGCVSQNALISDVPGTTCPNCPANVLPPTSQVLSSTPIVLSTSTTPAATPTVVNPVQTYSYYQINGRLYLVARVGLDRV